MLEESNIVYKFFDRDTGEEYIEESAAATILGVSKDKLYNRRKRGEYKGIYQHTPRSFPYSCKVLYNLSKILSIKNEQETQN